MGIREDLETMAEMIRNQTIPPPARSVVGLVDGPMKGELVAVPLNDIQYTHAVTGSVYRPCAIDLARGLPLMSCNPERWYPEIRERFATNLPQKDHKEAKVDP